MLLSYVALSYQHLTPVADRQLVWCRGSSKDSRGTAYIVYEDIYDAKNAVDHLSGFNVANRYLIVLYYNTAKHSKKVLVGPLQLLCLSPCYADFSSWITQYVVSLCSMISAFQALMLAGEH